LVVERLDQVFGVKENIGQGTTTADKSIASTRLTSTNVQKLPSNNEYQDHQRVVPSVNYDYGSDDDESETTEQWNDRRALEGIRRYEEEVGDDSSWCYERKRGFRWPWQKKIYEYSDDGYGY
jgi:hypothetical protein